jgi:4-hydroxybenzoate polyprenyltransferase
LISRAATPHATIRSAQARDSGYTSALFEHLSARYFHAGRPPPTYSVFARYAACLRIPEIALLQGSALLGAAFRFRHLTVEHVAPLAILALANVLLVAHVFVINDWANLTTDGVDPARAPSLFTARGVAPREMRGLAAGLLVLSLLLFGSLGPSVLAVAVGIAVLSAFYSLPPFNWKGRPLLSSAAHLAGGILHFLLGYSLAGAIDFRGVAIGLFFGLTFAAGHLTQELRDYQADVLNTIRTNAAIFGPRRTMIASLALFTLSQLLLLVLAVRGTVPRALAWTMLLYPLHLRWSLQALADALTPRSITRLQSRYRALYAAIGLAMLASLWLE